MRTLQQIITEITRDVYSARIMGGKRAYAHIEIPGSGGAHAIIYLAPEGESSLVTMHHDVSDKGNRITFQRGSKREDQMIVAIANFLVLHEAVRDRRNEEERRNRA